MKIAMIGQKGIPATSGGIERHVEELSAELAKRGHEVLVYCRKWYVANQTIREHRGATLVFTPSIRSKHLDAITHTFLSILAAARADVDVFHIHGVGPALLAWLPKLVRPTAKVVVTFHCIDRHHQKWNWFARFMLWLGERMACRAADATVAVSRALKAYCHLTHGTEAVYIPNGTQIPTHTDDKSLLNPFGLESGKYLMMCSRLVPHKGAHTLIEAWKHLRQSSPEATRDIKLAIVGGGAFTDAYVEKLNAMAAGDASVVMTGARSGEALHALFANAYVVVHPSVSEGLPIAVLEAMSYGKCVLSTDIPENLELTAEHGMTFRSGNVAELAEKMKAMLEHPDIVQTVGREARAHVARHYDWNDIAQTTEHLYEYLHAEPEMKPKTA